jgi:beta-lactamase superfamily II metal-dependent hydrolase
VAVAGHVIDVDLAKVWRTPQGTGFIRTLAWGDYVEVDEVTDRHVKIKTQQYVVQPDGSVRAVPAAGYIRPPKDRGITPAEAVRPRDQNRVLKVNFVDVQQGDGSVIETPQGKVILIDGGDNQLFARYLAGRYRETSKQQPKAIDCIVVTHGDADHFAGLSEIRKSETHGTPWKRLFIHPARVYHNGLVKQPSSVPEKQMLGQTVTVDGREVITELETDLTQVADAKLNQHFREWKRTLQTYQQRNGPISFRHLAQGDDDAFDFLQGEQLKVEVLGPILTPTANGPGLRFLGNPPEGPHIGHDPSQPGARKFGGHSASHTINGHSVILRLTYGKVRFLFAGDLNEEAELDLTTAHPERLEAEVFKVPHHGSADFSSAFIKAVSPVVSVVSSGDESSRKEYIHPRASLMGALGRHSRIEEPLILVTELVAFFEMQGYVSPERHEMKDGVVVIVDGKVMEVKKIGNRFFAFSRAAFGLVKTRTDGQRLLVYTDSANVELKEAYAYEMDGEGQPQPVAVRLV